MFVKHLGRTPSVIAAVCAAIICASLSAVTAGPIPSLAVRDGKRFQCADATHFFTNDDSSKTTQCPDGTVCGAVTDGSPCLDAGQGSASTEDQTISSNTDTTASGPPNKAAGGTPAYPEPGSVGGAISAPAPADEPGVNGGETCTVDDAEEEPDKAAEANQTGPTSEIVPIASANNDTPSGTENTDGSATAETGTAEPASEGVEPADSVPSMTESSYMPPGGATLIQPAETPTMGSDSTNSVKDRSESRQPNGQGNDATSVTDATGTQAGQNVDQGNAVAGDTPKTVPNEKGATANELKAVSSYIAASDLRITRKSSNAKLGYLVTGNW